MPDTTRPAFAGLIDAHCHLDYEPMAGDLEATFARAHAAGVEQFVHVGCSLDSIARALELASAHAPVFAVVGIHPHEASTVDDFALAQVQSAAAHPKVVGIGETGLDYHYDRSPRVQQQRAFERHLALADAVDKPIVLHIRDAHDDAVAIVTSHGTPARGGMVHCFTGTPSEAERWLALGFHISFSGIATFPRAPEVQEAARVCPADRLLLETDSPYLAPVPLRGRRNEPANTAFTCRHLAALRKVDPHELALQAARNTRTLLRIPQPT